MKYKILEPRENKYFKHSIQVLGMLNFHEARNWFFQTYGPCESLAHGEKIDNEHWTFDMKYQTYVIYVKGDEELSWFKLKYGESYYEQW